MKKIRILVAATLGMLPVSAFAQEVIDSTGLPGDNFDLRGAMELFKQSATPADFEKALNTESNSVNNLDLNGDKKIDYVKVIDKSEGKSHALIMQVPVSASETQDVAVIMIERKADSTARLQIIGNEVLYGKDVLMEPYDEVADKTPAGPSEFNAPAHIVMVNVWYWPSVQYLYYPDYVVYASPWGWEYYPVWWDPWTPWYWPHYYRRTRMYHTMYYQYTTVCYVNHAQNVYNQHRSVSRAVQEKYAAPRASYESRQQNGGTGRAGTAGRSDSRNDNNQAQPGRTGTPARTNEREVQPQTRPSTPAGTTRQPAQRQVSPPPQRQVNPAPAPRPQRATPMPSRPSSPAPSRGNSAPARRGR